MKKIETFIEPSSWNEIHTALTKLGVSGTLREVKTFGRKPAQRGVYRGSEYAIDMAAELELSVVVPDQLLPATVEALHGASGQLLISSTDSVAAGVASVRKAVLPERAAALPRLIPALARA